MLNGAAGKVLTLRSTSNSDPWYFNILADFTAGPYVDVEDSNNITNSYQITPDTADINSGNNLPGWLFTITNTNPNPPTSLGPTSFVDGGSQYNHNPTLDFVLFDPDSSDQVSYQLQISTSEDFLSGIIVDFKSALADQGSRSFVVGQDLLGGAYSVGSSGQNLPEGEYFWRVRAFDGQNASSGWSVPGQASVSDIKISEADPVLPVTTVIPAPPADSQTEEGIIAPENVVPLPESEPTVPQDVTTAQNQIALSQINKISLFDKIFSTIKEINLAIAEATHLKEKTVPLLASVSTLIVIAASAAATPLANNVTLFSFPEYLRSLLYSLFSLSSRRKRKEWGKVLEAGTALPIVQAKINLIKVEHPEAGPDAIKKLVASTYSGKDGSYAFLADPGQYQLVVEKDMFSVADVKGYYFDQILHVKTDKDSLIVPTIILSMKQEAAQKKLNTLRKLSLFEKVLFYLSFAFLIFGSITAISGLLKYPTNLLIVIIACLYPFLWFFTIKSLLRVSPVGNIRNAKSKQSVPLALIRIMDLTGKKLIKTAVSNEKGKYKTLIDKGIYKIFVTKSGYKQLTSVELNAKKNINTINQTIEVEKY